MHDLESAAGRVALRHLLEGAVAMGAFELHIALVNDCRPLRAATTTPRPVRNHAPYSSLIHKVNASDPEI